MERPSHTNFKSSCSFSCRITTFGLAAIFPLAVVLGLVQGLGSKVIDVFHGPLEVQFDRDVKPTTPPPDPTLVTIDTPRIQPPDFTSEQTRADNAITLRTPQPDTPQPPAAGPDRAAAAITSTHTIPPYPVLAQRLGAEGKVTLRLTVLADGTVGKAEIVTSSGRGDLDDAAEQWIVAHWAYRPALDQGRPVASQTVVSVVFSLKNQH